MRPTTVGTQGPKVLLLGSLHGLFSDSLGDLFKKQFRIRGWTGFTIHSIGDFEIFLDIVDISRGKDSINRGIAAK